MDTDADRARLLVGILLDPSARADERDDAATDLGAFAGPEVIQALIRVASDTTEDSVLVETAAESLGEIWARDGTVDQTAYVALVDIAQRNVKAVIRAQAPQLTHLLSEDTPTPSTGEEPV